MTLTCIHKPVVNLLAPLIHLKWTSFDFSWRDFLAQKNHIFHQKVESILESRSPLLEARVNQRIKQPLLQSNF